MCDGDDKDGSMSGWLGLGSIVLISAIESALVSGGDADRWLGFTLVYAFFGLLFAGIGYGVARKR